jgi:hypothetical protein
MDFKATRAAVLQSWQSYKPEEIVAIFRKHYANLGTLSTMLSHMKSDLEHLNGPPPDRYLSKIALTKKEYNRLRTDYSTKRRKDAMAVRVIENAPTVVRQAMEYIISSDPNLIWAGLIVCTGLRNIELIKVAQFKPPEKKHEHQAWWACQQKWAKRGTQKSKYRQCRDRPFLVPYWLIERGLKIVRKRWNVSHLGNAEIARRYNRNWQRILVKAYPMIVGVSAVLMRRFFASFSYTYFKEEFGSTMTLPGYASWVLGHTSFDATVLSYTNLILRGAKVKLFKLGKALQVKGN